MPRKLVQKPFKVMRASKNGENMEESFPEKPLNMHEVVQGIWEYLRKDEAKSHNGRVVGVMGTFPHPIAEKAYQMSISQGANATDYHFSKGTGQAEMDVIEMVGDLFHCPTADGYICSGGTEANIMALWMARNLYFRLKKDEGRTDFPVKGLQGRTEKIQVVVSRNVHGSLLKAVELLGFGNSCVVQADLDKNYKMDISKVKEVVESSDADTVAVVTVAGTTDVGSVESVDDLTASIPELSRPALSVDGGEPGIYLHVDAAWGGFILPFLPEWKKKEVGKFDFAVEGVDSMTMDPHKSLYVPPPAGMILVRHPYYFNEIRTQIPFMEKDEFEKKYWTGDRHLAGPSHLTLIGTRPGAPVLATWAALMSQGREGLEKVVRQYSHMSDMLYDCLQDISGVEMVLDHKPHVNIIPFRAPQALKIYQTLYESMKDFYIACRIHFPTQEEEDMVSRGERPREDYIFLRAILNPPTSEERLYEFISKIRELSRYYGEGM